MTAQFFKNKLSVPEVQKVEQIAQKLGISPNWLLGVMYFETSKTLDPSKTNHIGSVGLIQFTRDKAGVNYKTINGVKFYLKDIAKMSFVEQMDLVYAYYLPFKGKIKTFIDCYLVTFFPAALGKSDSYELETKSLSKSIIAKQNPIFDKDKNGVIKIAEIKKHFENYFTKPIFKQIAPSTLNIVSLIAPLLLFFFTNL